MKSRQAFARLDYMRSRWNEVQPTEEVRERAERLLRIHKLRAADALQLAAALVWCDGAPARSGADRCRWKSLGGCRG